MGKIGIMRRGRIVETAAKLEDAHKRRLLAETKRSQLIKAIDATFSQELEEIDKEIRSCEAYLVERVRKSRRWLLSTYGRSITLVTVKGDKFAMLEHKIIQKSVIGTFDDRQVIEELERTEEGRDCLRIVREIDRRRLAQASPELLKTLRELGVRVGRQETANLSFPLMGIAVRLRKRLYPR